MTRCRHTGGVLIIEHCRGRRIYHPDRALPVEVLDYAADEVTARCKLCLHAVTAPTGDLLPAWAQKAWRRARG